MTAQPAAPWERSTALWDLTPHPFAPPPTGHVDGPDACTACGWRRSDPRHAVPVVDQAGPAGVPVDGSADHDHVEIRTGYSGTPVRFYPHSGRVEHATPAERTSAILAEYRHRHGAVWRAETARDRALTAHAVQHARAATARGVATWGRAQLAELTGSDGGRHDHVLAYADGIITRMLAALDGETDPSALRFQGAMPIPPRTAPAPAPLDGQHALPLADAS